MKIVESVAELRRVCEEARAAGRRVGFVPTMGYFHAGHRSLMDLARSETDVLVVSLFVNPTQFGPGEDLDAYPRDLDADARLAEAVGVDVLFVPTVAAMYPAGTPRTTVHVAGLTEVMCGAARPTHFDGVTTVVAKLFAMVGPCQAYFGRKDFQQVAVVRRMVADLDLPVEVIGAPLVREPDGLALSSRNAYLTDAERSVASTLHGALLDAAARIRAGERDPAVLRDAITAAVQAPLDLEYVEIRDVDDLEPRHSLVGSSVIAVAARLGRARLIDNIVVTVDGGDVEIDDGVRAGLDQP